MWGMDLTMLPKSDEGHNYLVVAVDYLSKYVEAAPLKIKEAPAILTFFYICSRFGFPKVVITDQGREFCNQLFEDYCNVNGISHRTSTAYHLQTNGLTERMNASIKAGLRKLKERRGDWPKFLNQVLRGLRWRSPRSTKCSPFELAFGFQPRIHIVDEDLAEDEEQELGDILAGKGSSDDNDSHFAGDASEQHPQENQERRRTGSSFYGSLHCHQSHKRKHRLS
ncbi:hypothetical protein ACOMHN_012375 [Nucella lapillus]